MATAGGHNQAVPSTVERLDMSLDDIIKLQKEAKTKTGPAKAAKAVGGGQASLGVGSRVQKKQAPGTKKVLQQLQATAERGGSQQVRRGHVANGGRGRGGNTRYTAQGRTNIQNRAEQLQPNGVAQSHRPRAMQQKHFQNKATRIPQQPTMHLKPWAGSQATIREGMQPQQPRQLWPAPQQSQHNSTYRQGPQAAAATGGPRWWVQPTVRAQPQGKQPMGVQPVYQRTNNQRVSQRSLNQQSHHGVSLHRTGGGVEKPVRPAARVASAVVQQPRGSPASAPRTLNERFSRYGRNAGAGGSRSFGTGGLKVISWQ